MRYELSDDEWIAIKPMLASGRATQAPRSAFSSKMAAAIAPGLPTLRPPKNSHRRFDGGSTNSAILTLRALAIRTRTEIVGFFSPRSTAET